MQNFSAVWGALPIVATACFVVPAAYRLITHPTPRGLSSAAVLSAVVSGIGWLVYSLNQGLVVSSISSGLGLCLAVWTTAVWTTKREIDSLLPPVVLAMALGCATALWGATGAGVVLGVAPGADVMQVRRAWNTDVPALSVMATSAVLLRTLPWIPYAVGHRDLALGLWIGTCTVVNVALLVALLRHRWYVRGGLQRR